MDILDPAAKLDGYKLVFSPFLPSLEESGIGERMLSWVKKGGTWVVGPMSDIRNLDSAKYVQAPYGHLEQWAGVYCKYQIPGDPHSFDMRWCNGAQSKGTVWCDAMELRGAEAIATWAEGPMEGLSAITSHKVGKGKIVVLGTLPEEAALVEMMKFLATDTGVWTVSGASSNLVAVPRTGKTAKGMVVVEIENRPGTLTLDTPATDLLTGKRVNGTIEIPPYGVMVLKQ